MTKSNFFIVSLSAIAIASVVLAPSLAQQNESDIHVIVNMVQVNVAVTDDKGNYVTGLHPEDFQITEDGITEALPFDPSQLRDGYVAYTPKTNDVSIRLEVTAKDGSTKSESIRSVAIP